jgi:hypothetical protein
MMLVRAEIVAVALVVESFVDESSAIVAAEVVHIVDQTDIVAFAVEAGAAVGFGQTYFEDQLALMYETTSHRIAHKSRIYQQISLSVCLRYRVVSNCDKTMKC